MLGRATHSTARAQAGELGEHALETAACMVAVSVVARVAEVAGVVVAWVVAVSVVEVASVVEEASVVVVGWWS